MGSQDPTRTAGLFGQIGQLGQGVASSATQAGAQLGNTAGQAGASLTQGGAGLKNFNPLGNIGGVGGGAPQAAFANSPQGQALTSTLQNNFANNPQIGGGGGGPGTQFRGQSPGSGSVFANGLSIFEQGGGGGGLATPGGGPPGQGGNVPQGPGGGGFGGQISPENRLANIIGTGLPTDVQGLTDVAKSQGQQQFDDFQLQSNEQFGALGLGSSSASERAKANAAADISTNIGNTGITAGVGAQEAAANRSLGGFEALLGATGQTQQGNIAGQQAQQNAAALQQQGQHNAAQLATQGQQFQSQLAQQQAEQAQRQQQFESQLAQQMAQFNTSSQIGSGQFQPQGGGGSGFNLQQQLKKQGVAGLRRQGGGLIPQMAPGGLVPRHTQQAGGGSVNGRDFLTNLLFGTTFDTPKAVELEARRPQNLINTIQSPRAQQADPHEFQNRLIALRGNQNPLQGGRQSKGRKLDASPVINSLMGVGAINVNRRNAFLPTPGEIAGGGGLSTGRQGQRALQQLLPSGSQGPTPSTSFTDPNTGKVIGGSGLGGFRTGVGGRRGFSGGTGFETHKAAAGGEVPGPAVPPDTVPADINGGGPGPDVMLQGGELIVPVGLRSEIQNSTDTSPLMQKIKGLIGKAPEGGMQDGGRIGELSRTFLAQDAARKSGTAGDPTEAGFRDRENEGRLMAALGIPVPAVALAGAANEGVKALGQRFPIIGENLPGPFRIDETTSPASLENIQALVGGANQEAQSQPGLLDALTGLLGGGQQGMEVPEMQDGGQVQLTPADVAPEREDILAQMAAASGAGGVPGGFQLDPQVAPQFANPSFGPQDADFDAVGAISQLLGLTVGIDPQTGEHVTAQRLPGTEEQVPTILGRGAAPGPSGPPTEFATEGLQTGPAGQQPGLPQQAPPEQIQSAAPVSQQAIPAEAAPQQVPGTGTAADPFNNANLAQAGGGSGTFSVLGTQTTQQDLDDQRELTAQRRATFLQGLALQSPQGSRIQEMADKATAEADMLSNLRSARSEALTQAQVQAQGRLGPSVISAQAAGDRAAFNQDQINQRQTERLDDQSQNRRVQMALQAAMSSPLGFTPEGFQQALDALGQIPDEQLGGLDSNENTPADQAAVNQFILDNVPPEIAEQLRPFLGQ